MNHPPPFIRPDHFALGIILVCLAGFILMVSLKIHYSSIDRYNVLFKDNIEPDMDLGPILGTPKNIRSDEWLVATPTIISQFNKGFPVENPGIGAARSPLVMNIPVRHFSALFMPQNYGFFFLPFENAFSFLWNYRVIGLFLSTFLLLLLLTGNQTWLSFTGGILLLFSPYIQWFFSTFLGEYIIAMNIIVISSVGLVFSRRIVPIILYGLLLILFSLNLLMIPYPPFQIPLFYLIVTLFTGTLITRYNRDILFSHLRVKLPVAAAAFVIIGWVSVLYLRDIRETMDIVMNTGYPGKRFSTGGTLPAIRLFSGMFDIFLYETRYLWSNICETSTFILLFPFLLPVLIYGALIKKIDYLQGLLMVFLLLLALFMTIGISPMVAKITLFKMVPPYRVFFIMGIANIYLVILFLSDPRKSLPEKSLWKVLLFILVLLSVSILSILFNRFTNHFFKTWEVAAVTIGISIAIWLLLYKRVIPFTLLIMALVIQTTIDVFPVSSGASAITAKKIYLQAREIHSKDPEARWVVFGNYIPSGLLIAAGANVFNGPKYTPDLKSFSILDPDKKHLKVYNRYAHIDVQWMEDTSKIVIRRVNGSIFAIDVSPENHRFRQLGIKYLVFPADSVHENYTSRHPELLRKINKEPIDQYNFFEIIRN